MRLSWGSTGVVGALLLVVGVGCESAGDSPEPLLTEASGPTGNTDEEPTQGGQVANSPSDPAPQDDGDSTGDGDIGFEEGDFNAGAAMEDPADPIVSNAGDQYEAVGTNPFVITAFDPFSTFAADVDTASYDTFRRDIGLGLLPQADSVRLEEYVNSFHYDYPAASHDADVPFSISLAAGPSFFERNSVTLRVGIQGKLAPPDEKRPANLVFLIDTSGSMQTSDKLPLAKEVLSHSLEVLEASDTVSIVTYAGSERVALEPTAVAQKAVILDALDGLESGGSTAGAAGIELAYEQAQSGFIEGGINHVVLCTDGDFNVGVSSDEALVELIEEERKTGITLTVLGFGIGNLNDSMMEKVSNAGNGIYSLITDENNAHEYAEESLLATLTHIAKDVKLQVEFNPEKVYAYRLLGYENRAIVDDQFRDDTVDAGEIGSGHRVTALYELVLQDEVPNVPGAPEPLDGKTNTLPLEVDAADLVLVKVRYKDVDATETDPAYEVSASLPPEAVPTSIEELDPDFQWAVSVASFAEILKGSPFAGVGMLPAIQTALANPAHDDYADRIEFRTLFSTAAPMLITP